MHKVWLITGSSRGLGRQFTEAALSRGDPAAAARALLKLADDDNPPVRILFGTGFYPMVQQAYADRLKTWADWQDLAIAAQG